MQQIKNYGDVRQTRFCAFCGGPTETGDHIPSRVLLDEPYPDNLPEVPACDACNQSFALDEEYVACLIECAIMGSTAAEIMERPKIKRILNEKPLLAKRLEKAREKKGDGTTFHVEPDRVKNVMVKLARGHAAYELNEPQLNEPTSVYFRPLITLSNGVRDLFDNQIPVTELAVWPEVGCRAMVIVEETAGESIFHPRWVIVQRGRYRYMAMVSDMVIVRMVLSEYLACEVIWG